MLEPPAQENKIRFFYNIVEEVRNIMTTSIIKDIKECKVGNSNILEHSSKYDFRPYIKKYNLLQIMSTNYMLLMNQTLHANHCKTHTWLT